MIMAKSFAGATGVHNKAKAAKPSRIYIFTLTALQIQFGKCGKIHANFGIILNGSPKISAADIFREIAANIRLRCLPTHNSFRPLKRPVSTARRGARVVEWDGFENR